MYTNIKEIYFNKNTNTFWMIANDNYHQVYKFTTSISTTPTTFLHFKTLANRCRAGFWPEEPSLLTS